MTTKNRRVLEYLAVVSLAAVAGPGFAAATYCSSYASGTNSAGMHLTDVRFQPGTQPSSSADDCYGVVMGNVTPQTQLAIWPSSEYPWSYLVGDESNVTATYDHISYTLSGSGLNGRTSGTWNLAWQVAPGGTLPATVDLVLALKASNRYGLYLFEDVVLEPGPANVGQGGWTISFLNGGRQIPGLSHMDVFIRETGEEVPEPAAELLVVTGLAGLAVMGCRRPV